jgi:hypothetical protein
MLLRRVRTGIVAALLALAACDPVAPDAQPTTSPLTSTLPLPTFSVATIEPLQTVEAIDMTPEPTAQTPPGAQPLVDQAIADLAQRLSIGASEIELVRFEAVTWPDSSLGCPQPDMAYMQVLVEGYLIVLRAGQDTYEYHGSGARGPFFCENPTPPVPGDIGK